MNKSVFRVGVTRDFLGPDGTCDLDDIAERWVTTLDEARNNPNEAFGFKNPNQLSLFGFLTEQVCTGNILQRIHRYYKRHKCRIMMRS